MKIAHHPSEKILPLTDLSKLRWRLLWIYDEPLKSKGQTGSYWSYPTAAWLIRQGTVRLRFATGTETYGPQQWVFPRLAEGTQSFSRDAHILSIRFQLEWSDSTPLFDRHRSLTIPTEHPTAIALERAATRLLHFFHHRRLSPRKRLQLNLHLADYMNMQPLVAAWMVAYFRALTQWAPSPDYRPRHEAVNRVLQQLQSHPLHQPLRIPALAKEIGISVSQLNKIFVREMNTTPAAYWQEKKLRTARSWLLYGQDSIKVISYNLGFSSPENFTHWFRTNTGSAPKSFRESPLHL